MNSYGKNDLRYFQYSHIVLAVVFFLILVGGIVRTTGSGMGCPDWPKCFGLWVPPTCSCELPKDYKQQFVFKRIEKNKRVAKIFRALGNEEYAKKIESDPKVFEEQSFNPTQTWIEYINRLVGAITGILIFFQFVWSIKLFWKKKKLYVFFSFMALFITGVQAFLGSLVVSTNLDSSMLNAHFFLAFAIAIFICLPNLFRKSEAQTLQSKKGFYLFFILLFFILSIQIMLGTEVRILLSKKLFYLNDSLISFDGLGIIFKIHRTATILLLILSFWLYQVGRKLTLDNSFHFWLFLIPTMVLFQAISGIGMVYFQIPAWAQMSHVLFASVLFVSVSNVIIRGVILRKK
jgi:cytochrome c oxidase assembly protein subunit 15